MTANGQPDNARAARYIIKDFINGKLLYAHPPPDIEAEDFHEWPPKKPLLNKTIPLNEIRATKVVKYSLKFYILL